jgi:hypothetical protein
MRRFLPAARIVPDMSQHLKVSTVTGIELLSVLAVVKINSEIHKKTSRMCCPSKVWTEVECVGTLR